MARRLHFWCLIAVIALAPLPLGSNRPWSWSLLAALAGLLCLLWPLAAASDRRAPHADPWRLAVPAVLFVGVVAWAALQASSLLPAEWAAPLWGDAAVGLGDGATVVPRLAVDDFAVRTGVMRLVAYAGIFWLALQHGRSERRARWLIETLALAGSVYAVYGLTVFASGNETILLMRKWAYADSLTSTFVNRNTYATFAGLTVLCLIAAAARRLERPLRLRTLLLHFRRPTVIFALSVPIVAVSLVASGSRAGSASALLGAVTMAGCLWAAARPPGDERRRAMLLVAGGVAVLFTVLIAILSWADALAGDFSDRLRTWELTLELIAERPWIGHGAGGFAAAFAAIRPVDVPLVWSEAHNTFLELAVELGVPAAAALVAAVVWLLGMCVRGVATRRRDAVFPALGVAATVLVGVHSLFDFSLQVPGLTVIWAAILGVAIAQSHSTAAEQPGPPSQPE